MGGVLSCLVAVHCSPWVVFSRRHSGRGAEGRTDQVCRAKHVGRREASTATWARLPSVAVGLVSVGIRGGVVNVCSYRHIHTHVCTLLVYSMKECRFPLVSSLSFMSMGRK